MSKKEVGPIDLDAYAERLLLEVTGVADVFGMKPKDGANVQQGQPDEQVHDGSTCWEDDGSLGKLPAIRCFTGQNDQIYVEPPQENKRKWTDEEALNYQLARDAIGGLISIISAEKYAEENRENSDEKRLERLNAERSRLSQERRDLHVEEHEKISRIRIAYGAAYRFYYDVIASRG